MAHQQPELQAFMAALPKILAEHEGQFVVMKDGEPRKFLPSYETAIQWAFDTFGLDTFFVKEVTAQTPIAHFTRDVGPGGA